MAVPPLPEPETVLHVLVTDFLFVILVLLALSVSGTATMAYDLLSCPLKYASAATVQQVVAAASLLTRGIQSCNRAESSQFSEAVWL